MSRRVTLSDREIENIVNALKTLQGTTKMDYEIIKVGWRTYQDIIDKLQPMEKK